MSDRNQHSVDVIVEKVNVDVLVGVCWYAWELWVWLGVAMVVDVATAVGVGVIVDVCGGGCGWVWVDLGGCRCACRCVCGWVWVGGSPASYFWECAFLRAACIESQRTSPPNKSNKNTPRTT